MRLVKTQPSMGHWRIISTQIDPSGTPGTGKTDLRGCEKGLHNNMAHIRSCEQPSQASQASHRGAQPTIWCEVSEQPKPEHATGVWALAADIQTRSGVLALADTWQPMEPLAWRPDRKAFCFSDSKPRQRMNDTACMNDGMLYSIQAFDSAIEQGLVR